MFKEIILTLITCVLLVALVLLGSYLGFTDVYMFFWSCISVGLSAVFYMGINILFKLGE